MYTWYIHVHVYMGIHMYMHTYIYTYTYIYIFMYVYTYICLQILGGVVTGGADSAVCLLDARMSFGVIERWYICIYVYMYI
jgi:hypothetical protein